MHLCLRPPHVPAQRGNCAKGELRKGELRKGELRKRVTVFMVFYQYTTNAPKIETGNLKKQGRFLHNVTKWKQNS